MKIRFVLRDFWVGLYWDHEFQPGLTQVTTWYLCLVPCFPIIWATTRKLTADEYLKKIL